MLESKQAEFTSLFEEFQSTFVSSPEGQRHIGFYTEHRRTGQENFANVCAAMEVANAKSAEDLSDELVDLILGKLLPHADSQNNRDAGVWIHHASAITGSDIRKWYDASDPDRNWKQTAFLIFSFIQNCLKSPQSLESLCSAFANEEANKGFQCGMITPILNALEPQLFLLINSKSQKTINYFRGLKLSTDLKQYALINRSGKELIEELSRSLEAIQDSSLNKFDNFDMFCHWLVAIQKFQFQGKVTMVFNGQQYWRIQCQLNRVDPAQPAPGKKGIIGVGSANLVRILDEFGDLSNIHQEDFNYKLEQITQSKDLNATLDKSAIEKLGQLFHFIQLKDKDRFIIQNISSSIEGVGRITGKYFYDQEASCYKHRYHVIWEYGNLTLKKGKKFQRSSASTITLCSVMQQDDFTELLNAFEAKRFHTKKLPKDLEIDTISDSSSTNKTELQPNFTLTDCEERSFYPESELQQWLNAIDRKKQAIFYGPPGTGKTYLVQQLAKHLISNSYGIQELIQFHPAYTYEDFIQGIRPQTGENGLEYSLKPGRFLEFCERAAQNPDSISVLIIDEINRANLAQVFGELMYLLEYRDATLKLASGKSFSIPQNVRILGTMNTADRSIALVDHALRRRFAFIALSPNFEILRKYHQSTDFPSDRLETLIQWLKQINTAIGDRHYHLGTSFFLCPTLAEDLASIWQLEIEPYLEEYFFDQPNTVDRFRWDAIKGEIQP